MECSCGSQIEVTKCCEVFLSALEHPKTAEQLMRARYTAYSQLKMDYIANTHDPKTKKENDMEANKEWAENTTWLGLTIINLEQGGANDLDGSVEFQAKFNAGNGEETHHEISTFNKRNGIWFFTKGRTLNQPAKSSSETKVGRNDPCPCGSGSKYKKCCGAN